MKIWKKIMCAALAVILAVPVVPGLGAREVKAQAGNYVVVLDPGHGGGETGARARHDGVLYKEEEINWKISQYTKAALSRYSNIDVYLTKAEDERATLGTRVSRAADYGADILVSQHINSASNFSAHGASVMISKGTYRPYLHEKEKLFGTYVHQELGALGLYKRFPETGGMEYRMSENGSKYPNGQPRDYYGIVAQSVERDLPGVIIEHCFISNYNDATNYLRTDLQLKALGEADARAIVKYLQAVGGQAPDEEPNEDPGENPGEDPGEDPGEEPDVPVEYEEGWVKQGDDYYYRKSDGSYLKNQWLTIDDKRYYLDEEGRRVTGWMSSYYFDEDGVMLTGWQEIGEHKFYLGTNGKRMEGYRIINNVPYYFATKKNHGKDPLGAIQTGWKKLLGEYYYFTKEGPAATGWSKIQKHWYYMNKKGVMQTGWVQTKNGNHYYLFSKTHKRRGQRATSESIIRKGKKFIFNSKGVCTNYPGKKVR